MKVSINEFFVFLLQRRNFYARLAASLSRVPRNGMGTMGVGVQKGRITLYYDPAFVKGISMGAALFVLEHEMLHLALDHIPRYLELLSHCTTDEERIKARTVYNIAMDCAINSLLRGHKHFNEAEEFTKDWCLKRLEEEPEDFEVQFPDGTRKRGELTDEDKETIRKRAGMCLPEKYDLPDKRSFEFYQEELMKRVNVIYFGGNGLDGSCHDFWEGDFEGEEGGMSSDALTGEANRLREQLKRILRTAVRQSASQSRGLLPAEVEEFLKEYLADPVVPWWEVFVTRARTSKTSKFRRSVIVPNRALLALAEEDVSIIPSPGRIRDKSWRVFLFTDTSGSMSTESLMIVKNELNHMLRADEGMEVRHMEGDAAVHRDVVLHPGDEIPMTVIGRGGTDFDEYFKYMRQYCNDDSQRPDIVIVYTDGYAPSVDIDNRLPEDIPVIWLVTPQYSKDTLEGYGEIIVCDPAHNDLYGH